LLPTKENLFRKRIVQDPLCPICELDVKNTSHILWRCPSSNDVWGDCFFSFKKQNALADRGDAFLHTLSELLEKLEKKEV
jgi:hypothetical protein